MLLILLITALDPVIRSLSASVRRTISEWRNATARGRQQNQTRD
jgi:hypothetical protein